MICPFINVEAALALVEPLHVHQKSILKHQLLYLAYLKDFCFSAQLHDS